jgi:hypothetical protein
VVFDPCHLSSPDRPDRSADQLNLSVHVLAAPMVSKQHEDAIPGVNHLVDRASVRRPGLQPVEPELAGALQARYVKTSPGHTTTVS